MENTNLLDLVAGGMAIVIHRRDADDVPTVFLLQRLNSSRYKLGIGTQERRGDDGAMNRKTGRSEQSSNRFKLRYAGGLLFGCRSLMEYGGLVLPHPLRLLIYVLATFTLRDTAIAVKVRCQCSWWRSISVGDGIGAADRCICSLAAGQIVRHDSGRNPRQNH